MATTTEFNPDNPAGELTPEERARLTPRPLTSAATRLTTATVKRLGKSQRDDWQADAWDMYDLVGEEHFLVNTLAGRLGQAKFYVGRVPDDPTQQPEVVESGPAVEVFTSMARSPFEFAKRVERQGMNLLVSGDGYLLGVPEELLDDDFTEAPTPSPSGAEDFIDGISPLGPGLDDVDLATIRWEVHSTQEINFDHEGNVTVQRPGRKQFSVYDIDRVFLIRIWHAHPRYWWESDSATRACLPILRELVGLTMHVSAQVDSRLAGAGVLLVPQSVDAALRAQMQQAGQSVEETASPFADMLIDAMIAPIGDRSSASAVAPLVVTVPDDAAEKFKYLSFSGALDAEARNLREEAIRRLALSQDCPPELLLGAAGMNHWGAWLVREDVVMTHLAPPLALICDALTTQFLWPVLMQQGHADYEDYVIWFDVEHMIMRPDRSSNAKDLHAVGAISDEALRTATGFDDADAPVGTIEFDQVTQTVIDMVKAAPSLAQAPGLDVLLKQVRAMAEGTEVPPNPQVAAEPEQEATAGPEAETNTDTSEENQGPPTSSSPSDTPSEPASAQAASAVVDEYRPDPVATLRRTINLTHQGVDL